MIGKKLEVKGGVNVGKIHGEKLDIPRIGKMQLQKPKPIY